MGERKPMMALGGAGPIVLAAGAALIGLGCGGEDVTTPSAGSLEITTITNGSNPDPDGYTVATDGGVAQPIGINATLSVGNLAIGRHTVTLAGVAANCVVDGGNTSQPDVSAGATVRITFSIRCPGPTMPPIAFTSSARGLVATFVVNQDGTSLKNLTPNEFADFDPVWSPDGSKILFVRSNLLTAGLYLMNADGSDATKLVTDGPPVLSIGHYRWSPDGSTIAFMAMADEQSLGNEIWIIRADGSGLRRLVGDGFGANPVWSPDGRRIAFESGSQINIINSDGTGRTRVTNEPDRASDPAWSPDGSQIAFVTWVRDSPEMDPNDEISVINPDGTGLVNLTQGRATDHSPAWSPDGSRIAFDTADPQQPLESEVGVMNRDGSGRTILTSHPGFDFGPVWSPDGSEIVYTRDVDFLNAEIWVMNADGSAQRDVSNRPNTSDTSPDW